MKLSYIIIIFLSLYSCTTQRKVERYLNENKEFAASYCAEKFAVKSDTITIYETDTIRYNYYINSIDTITIDTSKTKEKIITEIKYRVKEIIKNTPPVTITKIVEVENTAMVSKLNMQIQRLQIKNEKLNNYKTVTFLIAFIIAAFGCLYFLIKYIKK